MKHLDTCPAPVVKSAHAMRLETIVTGTCSVRAGGLIRREVLTALLAAEG